MICLAFQNKSSGLRLFLAGGIILSAGLILSGRLFNWLAPEAWELNIGPSEFDRETPLTNSHIKYFTIYDLPLFLALIYPLLFSAFANPRATPESSRKGVWPTWTTLSTAGFAIFLGTFTPRVHDEIHLRELRIGLDCRWDHSIPVHGPDHQYGLASTGMYGLFIKDLEQRGARITLFNSAIPSKDDRESLTVESNWGKHLLKREGLSGLTDFDVIVLMVRTKPFSEEEVAELQAFMSQGGCVLLVGDHTNLEGCQIPFNSLSEPLGIKLRFDSAFSHSGWKRGKRVRSQKG